MGQNPTLFAARDTLKQRRKQQSERTFAMFRLARREESDAHCRITGTLTAAELSPIELSSMDAIIHVYTYKEGLLSKLAHDLRFTLARFSISASGAEVSARFEVGSLRVDGAIKSGKLERAELSQADRDKIHATVQDVLGAREYGEAKLSAKLLTTRPPFLMEGQFTLKGDTRPVAVRLERDEDRLFGELTITPSQWGIRPYRALGGTLKLQDRVRITIDASAAWLAHGGELNSAIELTWVARSSRSSMRPPSLY